MSEIDRCMDALCAATSIAEAAADALRAMDRGDGPTAARLLGRIAARAEAIRDLAAARLAQLDETDVTAPAHASGAKVLAVLAASGELTTAQIAEAADIPESTARWVLTGYPRLFEARQLAPVAPGRPATAYSLTPAGRTAAGLD